MMDLDNFKSYNDTPRPPGRRCAAPRDGTAISRRRARQDRVYRYGGDEFALILPACPRRRPQSIGERVRAAVARLTRGEASPVTISVGVAVLPADAPDKNGLIAAADTALYYGKRAGEDRLVLAREVPREMHDLRGTLDELARAALLHPDDAPTVDSLVEQAALLCHATEHGQDTVRGALLGVARSLDALDPVAIGHGERVGRLAGLVARKLGCDEGAAETVELAARLQGLEESAPTSCSRSRPCARSARSCAGIVAAARWSERRWARRCWPSRMPTTRWWRLPMGPMPSDAQPSTS